MKPWSPWSVHGWWHANQVEHKVTQNILYVLRNSTTTWSLMLDLDLWQKHSVKYRNTLSAHNCLITCSTVVTIPFGFTIIPLRNQHIQSGTEVVSFPSSSTLWWWEFITVAMHMVASIELHTIRAALPLRLQETLWRF